MKEGHATCGVWAEFFIECLAMHRISSSPRFIEGKLVEEEDL